MAWGIDRSTLENERNEALAMLEEGYGWLQHECVGRAYRWLDEPELARPHFEAAVAAMEELEDPLRHGDLGNMRRLLGDEAGARREFESALEVRADRPHNVVALRYLLGDHAGAGTAFAGIPAGDRLPLVTGIATLAERDAAAAREHFVKAIRAGRTPPSSESGAPDLSLFDWLEESYRLESELTGEPAPDHMGMLHDAGLYKKARPARRRKAYDQPPAPGAHTELDGATLDVGEYGDVELVLSPTVRVDLLNEGGEFLVRVTVGEQEEDLAQRYKGFRDAIEAAADFLRAQPEAGEPAAERLLALVTAG